MTSEKESNLIEKTRRYKFTQKQIKDALGIKGNLYQSGLWEGQSPHDIEINGEKRDEHIFYIETKERFEDDDE